jgi:large subunit ribosomal protein L29
MKIKEVRELSVTDLNEQVYLLKEKLFHLRAKQATGQLANGREITVVRKDIARIYTVLRERELGIK